jgi:hypothetical protein
MPNHDEPNKIREEPTESQVLAAIAYLDRNLGEQYNSPEHKGSQGDYVFMIGFVVVALLLGCIALVWLYARVS